LNLWGGHINGKRDMPLDDDHNTESQRFTLSEAEKARRLQALKSRLTVDDRASASRAASGGWLLPALFWTALIALAALAAAYWFSASRGDTAFAVQAGEALELRIGRGGHYELPGQIGAEPVRFIVDTGASLTSIPQRVGERLGIRECSAIGFDLSRGNEPGCCRRETFHTANGSSEGCVARVPSIRFGSFEVRNARVAVMPDIGEQALLGMNVLRQFSLVQQGNRLTITPAVSH
jgi:aspartyl protease family protein